jgi:hypothetical protein
MEAVARSLFLTLVVGTTMFVACGDGPTAPSATNTALTQTITSSHFVFHLAPGDSVDAAWQDRFFDWLMPTLQLQPSPPLDYHKYRDRAHLQAVTGRTTNGYAEPGTTRFHTIWPTDNHESVHTIVILQMGFPPALFTEGVAVAHSTDPSAGILTPRWAGTDIHALARGYDAAGRLPPLTSLLRSVDFFNFDQNIMYPCSGSFVRYLIDTYGLAPLKTYFAASTFDDAASATEAKFLDAYGRSIGSVWEDWRARIR